MRKINKAFSLVELLVVVTIIGILGAVAIPSYNNYVIKARVSELIKMSTLAQEKIQDAYDEGIPWATAEDLNLNVTSKYMLGIKAAPVDNALASSICESLHGSTNVVGQYIIGGNPAEIGLSADLLLQKLGCENNGVIRWFCLSFYVTADANKDELKYLPPECRKKQPNL